MSDVLFWQKRINSDDPFLEPTLPAAFYHPSLPKALTKEESQIKLCPEKLHHEEDKENIGKGQLTPEEKAFMQKTNTLLAKELPTRDTPSPRDTSSKFEESWPTSEKPSTIESPSETRLSRDEENGGNFSRTSSASTRSKTSSKLQMQEFNISSLLKMESSGSSSHQSGKMQSSQSSSQYSSRMKTAPTSPQHDSVLSRYIHRFRHGEPQSREERTAKGQSIAAKELWWLSSPPTRDISATSSSGTHSYTSSSAIAKHPKVPPASKGFSNSSVSSSSFHSQNKRSSSIHRGSNIPVRDRRQGTIPPRSITKGRGMSPTRTDDIPSSSTPVMDSETLLLQEKAQHLLEISESSLSSDPMVSSEGIGSSPSLPSREEMVFIPSEDISPIREKDTIEGFTRKPSQPHTRHQKNLRPEDDILYQWRLRRKMDLAKQGRELNRDGDNLLVGRERTGLGYGVPSTQDQYDSSLEAFRSQLRQSHSSNHMSDVPLNKDRQMSPPAVRTRGTDPIPQTTSTQTGTEEERGQSQLQPQSTLESSQERDLHLRLGIQHADTEIAQDERYHAYSLPPITIEQRSTAVTDSPPRVKMKQRPIASPNKEGASKEGCNILPHWHMSCDIIPCPQGNVPHSHSENELTRWEQGRTRTESESSTKDRSQSRERKREAVDEGERLLSDNEMEAVEDDDDRRGERQDLRELGENEQMQVQGKNRGEYKKEHKHGYRQSKGQVKKDFGFTQSSRIPQPRHRIGGMRMYREPVKGSSKGAPPVYQPVRKHKGTSQVESLDRTSDRREKTSPRSSDTEPFTDVSAEEDIEGSKQEVQSAIGQVITRRLFDPGSPKIPKTPSSALSKSATQGPPPDVGGRQEESTSDSDEFSDDNLLQMLRQKRALYEKQLQQIDDAITSKLQAR